MGNLSETWAEAEIKSIWDVTKAVVITFSEFYLQSSNIVLDWLRLRFEFTIVCKSRTRFNSRLKEINSHYI